MASSMASNLKREKILLVDDSPENLLAVEAVLESLGQELVKASSGLEALRYLLEDDFAAILLDVRMPEMDGLETAAMIRSRKRSRNTPIIFLTGYRSEETLIRGYDLGAVDFLHKPIIPEILKSKVSVFVELSRQATQLKEQAAKLERAERRFRAVLEAAPEAMVITDGSERLSFVNTQAERLFGHPRQDLLNRPVQVILPEWSNSGFEDVREMTGLTASGRAFPAEVSLNPHQAEEGLIVVGVVRDITAQKTTQEQNKRITCELEQRVRERTQELMIDIAERKKAESALRESEHRLRLAMDAAQMGIWTFDLTTRTISLSDRAAAMFNLEDGVVEIPQEHWLSLLTAEDKTRACLELEQALTGERDYKSEYRVPLADGAFRWLSASGQVLCNEKNELSRVIAVIQDITDRKRQEEAMHHRAKLESLGVLAGGIAHDFNNLLTGMLGGASFLLEEIDANFPYRSLLTNLVDAAKRAAQLTRQMLAYAGREQFIVRPVSLSRQVQEITALISASIPKHVTLQFRLQEDIPLIEVDESQLQQLIMNLVINAAEAVGEQGGHVIVSTALKILDRPLHDVYVGTTLEPGPYAVLTVQDNGHGMDDSTRRRIFDPFFTTKFAGRGLGLAAALGIIRAHRGAIEVESAPGAGTTFQICLPTVAAAKHVAGTECSQPDLNGAGTVLVVDDEPIVQSLVRNTLERFGYNVIVADDGASGLDRFRAASKNLSLVVLDMAMPGISGDYVFRCMKQLRPDIKVLASSGFSEAEAIQRFGREVAGFLQKPYTATELAAKVKAIATGG